MMYAKSRSGEVKIPRFHSIKAGVTPPVGAVAY
jgi:hypothetical protein